MEERSSATLENIQQAAMVEFWTRELSGRVAAADRKERRGHDGRLLWLLFQQRGVVCFHRGASRRSADGAIHGGANHLCRIAGI